MQSESHISRHSVEVVSTERQKVNENHVVLSIFVIATKNYLSFAETLIRSATEHVREDTSLKFLLLTDDVERAAHLVRTSSKCEILMKPIPSLGWPEVALMRYELLLDAWQLVGHDLVAYMDADMEFVGPFSASDLLEPLTSTVDMVLVSHPGYFNRNCVYRFLLKTWLGPWEHRRHSMAYVPRRLRKIYVCGGMFWGRVSGFNQLLQQLAHSVRVDLGRGIHARHFDESHLNRWFTEHSEKCNVASPEWAFDFTYRQLNGITPIVVAVRKPKDFRRILSE